MKKQWGLFFFILLCIGTLPALWQKIQTEQSTKTVEFSVDYLSLLSLSKQSENPEPFLNTMLDTLQAEGFTTLTLPNNTLASLQERGLVSMYTADELRELNLFADSSPVIKHQYTYLVSSDALLQQEVYSLLTERFPDQEVEELIIQGQTMLGIDVPYGKLAKASIPYLTQDLDLLLTRPKPFQLVLKLDNQWDGQEQLALNQLHTIPPSAVSSIYFADAGVLGYPLRHTTIIPSLPAVSFAYKEYFEAHEKQKGIERLTINGRYPLIRMHVIASTLLTEHLHSPQVVIDRMVKAVSERNIRLFHIQFPSTLEDRSAKATFTHVLSVLVNTVDAFEQKGYTYGSSTPFTSSTWWGYTLSAWCAIVLGGWFIVRVMRIFFPRDTWQLSALVALFALSRLIMTPLPAQLFALAVAISVPILLANHLIRKQEKNEAVTLWQSVCWFLLLGIASIVGGLLLASMHNSLPYLLYLNTFKGVALMHILPPLVVGGVLLWHHHLIKKEHVITLMKAPIRVYQLIAVGLIAYVFVYYVSRTGNSGVLLPLENELRSFLEHTFGVRPRTKEFLFAHPLMLLILFYWQRHRFVQWGLPIAIIGSVSIMNTFTHFHTPVLLSLQRSLTGLFLGLMIGLLCIGFIEAGRWLWRKHQAHRKVRHV